MASPPAVRTVADPPAQRGAADEVEGGLAVRGHAETRQARRELGAGERPVCAHGLGDQVLGALLEPFVQAELGVPAAAGRQEDRSEQPEQPPGVARRHRVQRAAHEPAADESGAVRGGDVPPGDPRAAGPQAEGGGLGVLGLDREDAADDLRHATAPDAAGQSLRPGAHQPGALRGDDRHGTSP